MPPQPHDDDTLRAARLEKLRALKAKGIAPYGGRFPKSVPIAALVAGFQDGAAVQTAGRLTARRGHGPITFADLSDAGGKVQLCFKKDQLGEDAYSLVELLDLGDWIGVEGAFFKTRAGELTIAISRCVVLSKSLRSLPEKWHGLKDIQVRYRRRYLDLAANAEVRRVFERRSRLLESLRRTLHRHGYLEVETPMMHPIPGGAAGEPFVTHHQALGMDLYLRLAPELYLKRLLVGGFERVYDLNRSFRNEGLSTRHNPEFTMLEAYCAYENFRYWMGMIKELICTAAQDTIGTLQLTYQGRPVNLEAEWAVVSFATRVKDGYDLDPGDDFATMQRKLRAPRAGFKPIDMTGQSKAQLLHLVEELVEPEVRETPVFVTDYWTEMSPLAKSTPENPLIAERFELFVGGFELANAYSELNDPIEQRARFEAQVAEPGGAAHRQIDTDFVEALEYGMPSATGLGLGVDRLAMVLFDQPSIKDVILFPTLKPED